MIRPNGARRKRGLLRAGAVARTDRAKDRTSAPASAASATMASIPPASSFASPAPSAERTSAAERAVTACRPRPCASSERASTVPGQGEATRIRRPASPSSPPVAVAAPAVVAVADVADVADAAVVAALPVVAAGGAETLNEKVDPSPGRLSTEIVPPIISVRRRLIARPSPVPPYCRVVPASACVNDSKRRAVADAGMPIPVSRTEKRSEGFPRSPVRVSTEAQTPPAAVNLTAFERRFRRTCLTRVTSPTTKRGTSGETRPASSSPLADAAGARRSIDSSTARRTSKGRDSSSSFPDSIFEKSRMSLMRARSVSPLPRIVSTSSACSPPSTVSARSRAIPITPFRGVRISWLMLARNALLARVASSARVLASASWSTRFVRCAAFAWRASRASSSSAARSRSSASFCR